ncbi:MAG: NAD(P)-dependent alcohol dehydrogenase [Deltaproteobacteria bacterium]|nr:NAD(P)-dependent alcohol dehydrogenase [Deltaproteobacteria bacterium]
MRAWEISGAFGLDNLKRVTRVEAAPGRGQVRLRMLACALNYRDLLMVRGEYNPRQALPLVPLSDGVGEVVEVGPDVTRVAVGDRVMPLFAQKWLAGLPTKGDLRSTLGGPHDGTLRESMVLSEEALVRVPDYLTNAEAATLPCAALTAWSALVEHSPVRPGETVLIQGTGGVSIFALQLAKLLGARTIVTSSSEAKRERARALGADETIDYVADPAWGKTAKELTGGVGVDHVVEVGGAGTFTQSARAVKPGGTISLIGILSGGASKILLTPILMQNIRVQGIVVGHRAGFLAMCRAFDEHQVRPVVDRTFPFEAAPDAFRHLLSQKHFGKVVIDVAE